MRRLLLLVGAVVLVDTIFFAALTPLLPEYADRFDLSKTGAGLLAGSYAAGGLVGTLPSGWLAMRAGSRRTMLLGLALLSLASVGFAFGDTIAVLDATRFLQGVGGACAWAGGMGWLVSIAPPEQRGATIGAAMSAALAGVLLGPVLGTIAQSTGPEVPFTIVGSLGVLLAFATLRMPAPARPESDVQQPYAAALRDARVRAGAVLVLVPALVFGTTEVLAPLELDRLGASALAIGATFLVAAGLEGIMQTVAGHATDRFGRALPIRIGLVGTLAFMLLVGLPQVAWLLAVVVTLGCTVCGALNTPAMTLLADGVEHVGLDHGVGFALVNLVWSSGQVGGAIAGGALAAATTDTTAYLALAAICGVTLGAVLRGSSHPTVSGRTA
ncbi:MAG: MFS transporter [Conexibacter sp.]